MTTVRFADDADRIRDLEAAMVAAEAAHTEACAAYRKADRSRSRNRLAILLAATERCEATAAASRKAQDAHAQAHRDADRRMAQALTAARRVAAGHGVQLSLDL